MFSVIFFLFLTGWEFQVNSLQIQHNRSRSLDVGQMKDMLRQNGWNLRVKAKSLPPANKWFILDHQIPHEYNNVELQGRFEALFSEAC